MRAALLVPLAALSLGAEPLSRGERDRAMSHLHASRKQFLDALAGLSEAQWKFKAGPDRWSIAEVAEHIGVSEDTLFGMVTGKLLKSAPAPAEKLAETKDKDELVMKAVPNREQRFQAPEMLRPTGRWAGRVELSRDFRAARDGTIAYVEKTGDELRKYVMDHPVLKALDAYQWILLIAAHTERHVAQIDEVKQSAGYPNQ